MDGMSFNQESGVGTATGVNGRVQTFTNMRGTISADNIKTASPTTEHLWLYRNIRFITWPEDILSVTIGLYQAVGDGEPTAVMEGEAQKTVTITKDSTNYTESFTGLPAYDENGDAMIYSVKELSIKLTDNTVSVLREGAVLQILGSNAQTWSAAESEISEGVATVTNTPVKTGFHILKVKADDMSTPLSGAKFRVDRRTGVNENNQPIYSVEISEFEVDANGSYEITGLKDGTYRIVETKAPTGYIALSAPITITVANGTVTFADSTAVEYAAEGRTLKVGNTPGVELPATGGPGTLVYTLSGLGMILLAGALLIGRRKRYQK